MTLALGIDPGTATTGYGLVRLADDGGLEAVAFGVILTPPHTPDHERLLLLYGDLKELIALHKPDTCGVEKLFFQRNVSTAITVGQARGVILLAIAGAGLDTFGPLDPTRHKLMEALSPKSELWDLENVIIMPNNAASTPHYYEYFADLVAENYRRAQTGRPFISEVA